MYNSSHLPYCVVRESIDVGKHQYSRDSSPESQQMQRRFLTSMPRPASRPSCSQCMNEGTGLYWTGTKSDVTVQPCTPRWKEIRVWPQTKCHLLRCMSSKRLHLSVDGLPYFLCHAAYECSDFSEVSKNKAFNLIPTPYEGNQTMADLRLSHCGPRERAFRDFITHICSPADSALLILKTDVLRTDSYRSSTVLPRGIRR